MLAALSSFAIAATQNQADIAYLQNGVRELAPGNYNGSLIVFVRIPGHVNNHSGDVNNGFRADVNNRFRGQVNGNFALPGIFIHIPELIS